MPFLSGIKRRIKKIFVPEQAQEPVNDENYWENRARRFGKHAVINLGHGKENFEAVKRREEKEIFPLLRGLCDGREHVILDFGCGPGRFTTGLAALIQGRAVGVDPTAEFLKKTPKNKNTEFHVLENGRIPLPDRSVDIVWTFNVLGCVKNEDLAKTAAEFERVLSDKGLLFFVENTTEKENVACYTYRRVNDYISLFRNFGLQHVHDHFDKGPGFEERLSVIAGRKK